MKILKIMLAPQLGDNRKLFRLPLTLGTIMKRYGVVMVYLLKLLRIVLQGEKKSLMPNNHDTPPFSGTNQSSSHISATVSRFSRKSLLSGSLMKLTEMNFGLNSSNVIYRPSYHHFNTNIFSGRKK